MLKKNERKKGEKSPYHEHGGPHDLGNALAELGGGARFTQPARELPRLRLERRRHARAEPLSSPWSSAVLHDSHNITGRRFHCPSFPLGWLGARARARVCFESDAPCWIKIRAPCALWPSLLPGEIVTHSCLTLCDASSLAHHIRLSARCSIPRTVY